MAWINIKWTDEKVQNTIGKWNESRILNLDDWMVFSNVYGLPLASYTVPARAEFRNKAIHIPVEDNILQLRDPSLFDSQKLKFKLSDNFVTTIEKDVEDNIYYVTASSELATEITLYLTDVGINIVNYHSYRWSQKSLLENAFLGDAEIESSDSNQIVSKDGFITYKGYRSLGAPISGLGANLPYENHQSFDTNGKGYQYFDFINKNSSFEYIGYFSSNGLYSSGHWGENNEFIDKNNNKHYGPFIIYEYSTSYKPGSDKADWLNVQRVYFSLIKDEVQEKWYVYTRNSKSLITDSDVTSSLKNSIINWTPYQIIDEQNEITTYINIELPIADSSFGECFSTVSNNTSYFLTQVIKSENNRQDFFKAYNPNYSWKSGVYTDLSDWLYYQPRVGNWTDTNLPINYSSDSHTTKRISIIETIPPIHLNVSDPTNYPFLDPDNFDNWGNDYKHRLGTLWLYQFGNVGTASEWLMKDFIIVNSEVNGPQTSTVSIALKERPTTAADFLTESLSTWAYWANPNYTYSFLTLMSPTYTPKSLSLIFAVKNLAGEDFSDPNAANQNNN